MVTLENAKVNATQLLGQVNMTIEETINNSLSPTITEYERLIEELGKLLNTRMR